MKVLLSMVILFFSGCSIMSPFNSDDGYYKRVALVIGNNKYPFNGDLNAPILGVRELKPVLEKIGYKVYSLKDATKVKFDNEIRKVKRFIQENKDKKTIFYLYFAGHGHTETNRTAEAFIEMTDTHERTFLSNYYLYDKINELKATYSVISIDACLNITTPKYGNNVIGQALNIPDNVLMSYATGFTERAHDKAKNSSHSIYMRELLEKLKSPEIISVQRVFNDIERSVKAEMAGQTSFHFSTLTENIVFPRMTYQSPDVNPR